MAVVGGGPAGSTCSAFCAANGLRTLLIERENFPREKVCGGFLSPGAVSILEEMKTIKKAFPYISTSEMLVWATSNGAKALAFEDNLGDFTRGKKPGVVLLENITDGEITWQSTSRRLL